MMPAQIPAPVAMPPQSPTVQPSTAKMSHDMQNYVNKATILIHSPKITDNIIKMLSGPNPVQQVADACVMVMQRLDAAGRGAGVEIQDVVKVFSAQKIVELLAELGTAAKKFPKMTPNLIELSLSVAVQDYVKAEVKAGRIDPKKLQVTISGALRTMAPDKRKQIQQSMARVQQTAVKYNNNQGAKVPVKPQTEI